MSANSRQGSTPIRLAAVQAASVFLDRNASLEKAYAIIKEAADHGANIIAFPEGFIPGHPVWFHFRPASDRDSLVLAARLSENALELGGPEIARLCSMAAQYSVFLVMGCCERAPARPGTLYNTLVFIPMVFAMYYHVYPPARDAVKMMCTCAHHHPQVKAAA